MVTKDLNEKLNGLTQILGVIADPVIVLDSSGLIVTANNNIEKYGTPAEELINKNLFEVDFFDKKQSAIIKENLGRRLRGEQVNPYEVKLKTRNSKQASLEVNAKKVEYNGQLLDVIVLRDVTQRAQEHRKSEERFNGITHSIKDALILVDEEGKVTYWNPAAETTFGYTNQEALGKHVHELVLPNLTLKETKERINESLKVFAETGIGYFTVGSVEVIARRKDGSEFPAELSVSPMRSSGRWNAIGVVKDITTRKVANQKMRDAEQKYHTLFSQAPLGVMIIDPATLRFAEFNDVAHLQLGYTREEFEKITVCEIQADETPEQVRAHVRRIIENGNDEFTTKQKTKTGETRNVVISTKTFKSLGKEYLHCIAHDVTEKQKIQDALLASETRFRQLVEVASEGIWAINNDYETVFVNPRMAKMIGYEEDEILGKKLFDFIDPEWVATVESALLQFSIAEAKSQYEYAFPTKNGGHVQTTVNLSVITDDGKRKVGILAVVSDTTKRKQLEEELRSSEERFRVISTSAIDAIILSDQKDRVLYWNPAAEKLYGYTEKEAVGKILSELILPREIQSKHAKLLNDLSKQDISKREFGVTAIRRDGAAFLVDLFIVSVKLQGQKCLLTIIKDITEWKKMEEKLRQERDLLESVTANTNIILALIYPDYRVAWANRKAKLSTQCENIEGRYCYETFGRGAKEVCEGCGVKRIFENGENLVRRDYSFIVNNKEKWVELITTPIKDKNGNVTAALEISIDINERKHLQNKLAEYSQRLEEIVQKRTDELKKTQAELVKSERLAAIGELAGMVGHDLRNPLTGIKNSAYYLKKKGPDLPAEQAIEMLEIIDKCVNYSNRIVNDLLDYSREIQLTVEKHTPQKLLQETITLIDIPKTITINNKLKETPAIWVDPDKIKRVFINLIKNSIDALPSGGEITVESQKVGHNLMILFTDNGEGISDEILPKLFTPLCTTKAQGMGFGLAICKRIIEAHKGTITVKTVKGQGTTFTITIPVEGGGETHG